MSRRISIKLRKQSLSDNRPLPLSSIMGKLFRFSSLLAVVIFGLLDLLTFSWSAKNILVQNERNITQWALGAIKEPVAQGSFVEADRRLQQMASEQNFFCAKLEVWNFSSDLCNHSFEARRFLSHKEAAITLPDSNEQIGKVTLFFDHSLFWTTVGFRSLVTVGLCVGLSVFLSMLFRRLSAGVLAELERIVQLVKDDALSSSEAINTPSSIQEFQLLGQKLKELIQSRVEYTKQQATQLVARQVAHDIRSPLGALEMALQNADGLAPDRLRLASSAIARIKKIANDLLQNSKPLLTAIEATPLAINIASAIDDIVSEKRSQINLTHAIRVDVYERPLMAKVDESDFQRMLSNIINNSLEAAPNGAKILISAKTIGSSVEMIIQDNGCGFHPEVLKKLGQPGVTTGKETGESGFGLGLWHAYSVLKKCGGKLDIESEPGKGTKITVLIPK